MYTPAFDAPSESLEALAAFVDGELRRISESFGKVDAIELVEINVAPARTREGMIVLADGTNWNPGSGAGFYGFRGGAWVLLG